MITNPWCWFIGHDWSWPTAIKWGYLDRPMCRRCNHVPGNEGNWSR